LYPDSWVYYTSTLEKVTKADYLLAPTTQLQCDEGASATTGFSIASNGELEYQGSNMFIACETGQNAGMNIYTTNSTALTQCKNIKLTADSCSGSGAGASGSSSSAVPSTMSSAAPSPAWSSPAASASAGSSPAASVPAGSAPSVSPATSSAPAASSVYPGGPASSAECLTGSPVTTTVTVTASDCACTTSAPAAGGASGSAAPSSSAPAAGGGGAGSQPSGGAGVSQSTSSATPAPSAPAGGVHSSSPAAVQPSTMSSAAATSATSFASMTSSAGGHCPTTLTSGNYQYPHLIIPVDSSSPDTAAGTSYNGTVSSTISTIFNFDIPSSYSDKTCSLVFLFPKKADLETSSYSFSGDGKVDFSKLSSVATQSTDYSNAPSVSQDLGEITISPGNSYVLSTFACPSGETIAYEMKNAGSTKLDFFEDWNPSPLGLFITTC
jgi:Cobalamin biosynthesis protein CobN and related Mg-chelatases